MRNGRPGLAADHAGPALSGLRLQGSGLGLRDRDELHEIASAMGVRGATRLRKADLIEAILDKATTGASVPEPTGEKPKKRTTRKKTAESAEPAEAPESGDRAAQAETAERAWQRA